MKLFAATETGQSPTSSGESDLLAGELLMPAEQCDKAHCMCRREFVGVATMARTMHAKVIELDVDEHHIRGIAQGYVNTIWPDDLSAEDEAEEIEAYMHDIMDPAASFEVGTVVERWGHELRDISDNPLLSGEDS